MNEHSRMSIPGSTCILAVVSRLNAGYRIPDKVETGDLVLIHDMVWHKSLSNISNRSRNIFTWQLFNSGKIDSPTKIAFTSVKLKFLETSKWDETCWLQYPKGRKFMTFSTES